MLTMMLGGAASPGSAQQISQRVTSAPDGTIRLSFPARPEVCGDGTFIGEDTPRGFRMYSFHGNGYSMETLEDVQPECRPGPLRLVVTKTGGRITAMNAAVGVAWRSRTDATDLGEVAAEDAATWLLDIAASVTRDRVQAVAFVAANAAAGARIADRLFSMARSSILDADMRARSIRWLAEAARRENRSSEANAMLQRLIRDDREATVLRERAIRELEPGTATDAFLKDTYRTIGDLPLRDGIIRVLARSRNGDSHEWVKSLVTDRAQPVELRDRGIRVMAERGTPSAELGRLYDELQPSRLRMRLIRVLAERGDEAAVDQLILIAGRDPDPDTRRMVVRRLGETSNPRARSFLENRATR